MKQTHNPRGSIDSPKFFEKQRTINSIYNVKLVLVVLVLLTSVFSANAQVNISLNPPTGFQFKSEDVWNFNVIYSQRENVKVHFESTISLNGLPVVKLTSVQAVLKPGVNTFLRSNLRTQRIQYLNSTLGKVEQKLNHLPAGNYNYCVRIVCDATPDVCQKRLSQEMILSACEEVPVEQSSPLVLSMPEDESKIKEKRPNFSWIPPMPIGADPDIRYQMTLVQLKKGQSAEDGISRNRALYQNNNIAQVQLVYPPTLNDLIAGEKYAWQVKARINNVIVASSEVWEFEVEKIEELKYIKLTSTPSASIYSFKSGESLYFSYQSKYSKDFKSIHVVGNEINEPINVLAKDVLVRPNDKQNKYAYGLNTYQLELDNLGLDDGTYTLKVVDVKGKKYEITFNIVN